MDNDNRQIMPNSNEPSSTLTTTQPNSTQPRQFLQPDNFLNPFYNQSFFTLRGPNNSLQNIQNETSHLNSLTFDFLRPQQPLLRSNFNNIRPQTVPIFVSNQNSNLNFLSPLNTYNQSLNNFSVGSRNFWNTESLLQNIERTISQSTPQFIPYNAFSPHIVRRIAVPDLLSVTSQETIPFIPTPHFRALPFASTSSVSLPPIASFDSIMAPLTTPDSSSTINLPASIEIPSANSDGGETPITTNANIITISVSVQTEPTESMDQKATIKSPKRKKNRKSSSVTNNDEFSEIDSDEKRKLSEKPKEWSPRRSSRIANDKQKRVVFYETLSQLSKKRKRVDGNDNNDKDEPLKRQRRSRKDELQEIDRGNSQKDETSKRRGRPRKDPNCRPCGKQVKVTSSRKTTEKKFLLRRSERLSMRYKDNKQEI